jgi:hypothetical protein
VDIKKVTRRLDAFEMKCYRRLLHVSWTEKRTNNSIRSQINRMKTVTTRVMERKINLFGHICRMKDDKTYKNGAVCQNRWKKKARKACKKMDRRHYRMEWRKRMDGKDRSRTEKWFFGQRDGVVGLDGLRTMGNDGWMLQLVVTAFILLIVYDGDLHVMHC